MLSSAWVVSEFVAKVRLCVRCIREDWVLSVNDCHLTIKELDDKVCDRQAIYKYKRFFQV
ncbi:MAG: hypothetical protein WA919_25405 [Coleofasciculaceae cyanobacterium]